MIRYLLFVFFALVAFLGNAVAGEYQLDWHVPDEELIYHSCGCADSCWVAEVRQAKVEKLIIAKLRCDCEKLYFTDKTGVERVVAENCVDLNTDNKMDLIPKRIKQFQSHFNTPH
ncbi:hypothetical protein V8687_18045 [Shewanella baltica]|uniref:hypothetical protein n=1 Tax=Shewanella baltica TaxID=62322 RepID=UPI0030CC923E